MEHDERTTRLYLEAVEAEQALVVVVFSLRQMILSVGDTPLSPKKPDSWHDVVQFMTRCFIRRGTKIDADRKFSTGGENG